jgi:hypothetical protein
MKRYSPERKAAVLAKLLPPYNMTVTAHARKGYRLYPFIGETRPNGRENWCRSSETTDLCRQKRCFAVIVETATLK